MKKLLLLPLLALLLTSCVSNPKRDSSEENYRFKLQHLTESCIIKLTNAGVSDKLIKEACVNNVRKETQDVE